MYLQRLEVRTWTHLLCVCVWWWHGGGGLRGALFNPLLRQYFITFQQLGVCSATPDVTGVCAFLSLSILAEMRDGEENHSEIRTARCSLNKPALRRSGLTGASLVWGEGHTNANRV